jgi:G3E family GTPase
VLVNDFGQADIAGADFSGPGAEDVTVSKVAAGCICCTAKVNLRVALMQLLRKARPQRLLIEPAGLAHPAAVIDTLRDPWLAEALDLRAVICIADPRQFAGPLPAATETYLDQLALADVIVASKADLATPTQLQALLDYARALIPPKLRVLPARNGEFPLEWLDLAPASRGPLAAQKISEITSAA